MPTNDVIVRVKGEAELAEMRSETQRTFARVESDARDTAAAIELPFDQAGRAIPQAFESAERGLREPLARVERVAGDSADGVSRAWVDAGHEVSRSFDDAGTDIAQDLSRAGEAGDRAADDLGGSFDDSAERVSQAFDGTDSEIERDLAQASTAGDRAAIDIRDSFDGAADRVGRSFDGVEAQVRSDLDGVGDAGDRAASDLGRSFDRAGARIPRAFDGLRSDLRATFSRIEGDAGDAADGVADQFSGIADNVDVGNLGGSIVSQLGGLASRAGPIAGVALGIGAVFGDEVAAGFNEGFGRRRSELRLSIRSGLDDVQLDDVGEAAGEAYSAGFGEGLEELRDRAALVEQTLGRLDSSLDLGEATRQASTLADVFEIDLNSSLRTTQRLLAAGLISNTEQGFDLITDAAQRFRLDIDDILDVAQEFSPIFAQTGLDGAQAFDLIGRTVSEGLLPSVDRAAELVEEFNTRVADGSAADAIGRTGLAFENIRRELATGLGEEALQDVVESLLAIEDTALRDELAIEVFGASMEQAADRTRLLEVILESLNADLEDTAGAMDDVTARTEEAVGGFQRLGREVESVGSRLGTFAGKAVELGFAINDALSPDTGDELDERLAERFDTTRIIGLTSALRESDVEYRSAAQAAGIFARRTEEVADEADDAAVSMSDLRAELDGLFGFDADQLMRRIWEETERLGEVLEETDSSLINFKGGIDVTTDAGRDLQAQLERVAGTQRDLIEAYNEGSIEVQEFADRNAILTGQLYAVLSAAGLTEGQIEELLDKYLALDDEVVMAIKVDGEEEATSILDRIKNSITRLAGGVRIPVSTSSGSSRSSSSSSSSSSSRTGNRFVTARADGGPAIGETFVGEEGPELAQSGGRTRLLGREGPELVDFDQVTTVYSADETRRVLAEQPGLSVDVPDRDTGGVRQVLAEDLSRMLARQDGAVPRMAGGGAARDERLVVIGDNFGAQFDPEVASPLSLMTKAMRDALKEHRPGPMVVIQQVVVRNERDADRFAHKLEQVLRAAPS